MSRSYKIAFVGNYQYNCGSSNTLLGYVKAGKILNGDIRVSEFGYIDSTIRTTIPVADRNWQPDLLVIVYESWPFLSSETINEICAFIPRSKRILIDPDGKYSEPCPVEHDNNHPTPNSYTYWTNLYDSLSDVILQPFINKETKNKKNVHSFLYFGMDNKLPDFHRVKKEFDLLYVGNNWYRWHDIKWLVKTIAPIRSRLKRIGLIGQFWAEEVMKEFKEATYSEPDLLRRNNIEILGSAPYGQVEKTMSRSLLNPIFIRPILSKLEFVTPRMFETIMADTVPLIPSYFKYAHRLFGDTINQLTLSTDHPTDDLERIIQDYEKHKKLAKEIKKSSKAQHSYEIRLKQLLQYV